MNQIKFLQIQRLSSDRVSEIILYYFSKFSHLWFSDDYSWDALLSNTKSCFAEKKLQNVIHLSNHQKTTKVSGYQTKQVVHRSNIFYQNLSLKWIDSILIFSHHNFAPRFVIVSCDQTIGGIRSGSSKVKKKVRKKLWLIAKKGNLSKNFIDFFDIFWRFFTSLLFSYQGTHFR